MAFYINLDGRPDRRAQIEAECAKLGVAVERFPAIHNAVGAIGCTESHLEVLKEARARHLESVTIFEDDFQALVTRAEYAHLVANLPPTYDVMMWSYNLYQGAPYSELFGKVLEVQTASCYRVHSRFYDTLIARFEEGLALFKAHPEKIHDYINDQYWKPLQPAATWLYSLKRVGNQRPSWSDIEKCYVDYGV